MVGYKCVLCYAQPYTNYDPLPKTNNHNILYSQTYTNSDPHSRLLLRFNRERGLGDPRAAPVPAQEKFYRIILFYFFFLTFFKNFFFAKNFSMIYLSYMYFYDIYCLYMYFYDIYC